MTADHTIQVPGQLELPLEFDTPITKTVTYFETYTEVVKHTAILTVSSRYKALIEAIESDQETYQRTLKSLVTEPGKYEDITVSPIIESRTIEEFEDQTDFRIK